MPRIPRRHVAFVSTFAGLVFAAAGCRAPDSAATARDGAALPTLEDIFFLPGQEGRPPSVQSMSADGRWAFVRWSPLKKNDKGEREFDGSDSLRFLATDLAKPDERAGESARDLFALTLPADAKKEDRERDPEHVWSKTGHRMAIVRGADIWFVDAPSSARGVREWSARRVYTDAPESKEAGDAKPARLAKIRSLEFVDDDRELRVDTGEELYVFDLPRDPNESIELKLENARCLSIGLDVATSTVEWSRDFKTAFNRHGAFALADDGATPPKGADDAAAKQDAQEQDAPKKDGEKNEKAKTEKRGKAQILHLETKRAVLLADLADMKNTEGLWFSPDGRFVIGAQVDRGGEPPPNLIPDYLTTRVSTHDARRERADDMGATRKIFLWNTDDGAKSEIAFPGEPLRNLRGIGWSKAESNGALFAFSRQSDDWRDFDVFAWTESGLRSLFHDHDERWYDGPEVGASWSGDGRTLIVGSESTPKSTTPGRCQLFALDPKSGLLRQLTNVAGEVSGYDTNRDGSLVFVASDEDPARRVIGFVSAEMVHGESGGHSFVLTTPAGFQGSPQLAERGDRVLFAHQTLGIPAEIWSTELRPDGVARQLTRTAPKEFVDAPWIRPVSFDAVGKDGYRIYSHVYLPRGDSLAHPDRARGCVCFIHGAGYLQNVTDSMTEYEPNLMFHSRLADEGFVVVDVDYRGSKGYGSRFRSDVQNHLGELELIDIHTILDALDRRGVIDAKRVGCYGGSYGGFMTLMALFTEPGKWKCGAALRSVTDWRTYHPGYTQPRLGRPSKNEAAYKRSCPIDLAEGLRDPLLILHGMEDDNVFAQDSIRLIDKLIQLGKDFDAMLYPREKHTFTDGHDWVDEYRRIERFLKQHIGPP